MKAEVKTELKKGQTVTIYTDPLTEQIPQGEAKLIRFIKAMHGCEHWAIRFKGGTALYNRWVKV